MPQSAGQPSRQELFHALRQTLPELIRSQPLLIGGTLLMGVVQGLMPAVTILLGRWTVDGVGALLTG